MDITTPVIAFAVRQDSPRAFTVVNPATRERRSVSYHYTPWGIVWSDTASNTLQVPCGRPENARGDVSFIEAVRVWQAERAMEKAAA